MIKKHFAAMYAGDNIVYFSDDSCNVIFSCNEMGILNIDLRLLRGLFCWFSFNNSENAVTLTFCSF